jgi:hypothetical protein
MGKPLEEIVTGDRRLVTGENQERRRGAEQWVSQLIESGVHRFALYQE